MGDPGPALLRKRVVVHGVVSKPTLNGSVGDVLDFNEDNSRYSVLVHATGETVALKSSNLQVQPGGEESSFAPKTRVELHGLVNKPGLNGCGATVESFDVEARRFVVLLDGKLEKALFKAANLKVMPTSRRQQWEPKMPDENAAAQIEEANHDYIKAQWKNANPFAGIIGQAQGQGAGGAAAGGAGEGASGGGGAG